MTKKNNVIKFPGKSDETNKQLDEIMSRTNMPEGLKETEAYAMTEVEYSITPLKPTPDLMKGAQRNRRWAAIVSLGVIPGFEETPVGPVLLPKAPTQLFTADSLDLLKQRLFYEIEQSVALAKIALESPEEYSRHQMARMASEMQPDSVEK